MTEFPKYKAAPSKKLTPEVLEELGFMSGDPEWAGIRIFRIADCHTFERGFSIECIHFTTENIDRFFYMGRKIETEIQYAQDIFHCIIDDYMQRGAVKQLEEIRDYAINLFRKID